MNGAAALSQPTFGAARTLDVRGRTELLYEAGEGAPLLYLHGLADVHAATADWLPAHRLLAAERRLIAPAHPGCSASTGLRDVDSLEDLVFHYLDLLDALVLERVDVVGNCLGGWIAAELAIRRPERIRRLALVGATGLYVPGASIGDVFMFSLRRDGADLSDLRALLFARADAPAALEVYPDRRLDTPVEVLRYKAMSFAGRIGWTPPYLYDRKLRGHLWRVSCPTLVLWGRDDRMVPLAHGRDLARRIAGAQLEVIDGWGHDLPDALMPTLAARLARHAGLGG
jgi:pimeloyl-ACP methyl ester carboxylesterase